MQLHRNVPNIESQTLHYSKRFNSFPNYFNEYCWLLHNFSKICLSSTDVWSIWYSTNFAGSFCVHSALDTQDIHNNWAENRQETFLYAIDGVIAVPEVIIHSIILSNAYGMEKKKTNLVYKQLINYMQSFAMTIQLAFRIIQHWSEIYHSILIICVRSEFRFVQNACHFQFDYSRCRKVPKLLIVWAAHNSITIFYCNSIASKWMKIHKLWKTKINYDILIDRLVCNTIGF